MAKKLIINADDFGISRGGVDSILRLNLLGVVTSTTLMATGPAFDYAIQKLREHTQVGLLSVGVHLDATTGTPVLSTSEIPSLLGSDGRFIPRPHPETTRSMNPDELYREFRAQIDRVIRTGIEPSHLDNHHSWIYFDSRLFEVLVQLAKEYHLPIRYPFANLSAARATLIAEKLRITQADFSRAIRDTQTLVKKYEVPHPDYFWIEFTSMDRSIEKLEALISNLPEGISELCVHPGTDSERQREELGVLAALNADILNDFTPEIELESYRSVMRKP